MSLTKAAFGVVPMVQAGSIPSKQSTTGERYTFPAGIARRYFPFIGTVFLLLFYSREQSCLPHQLTHDLFRNRDFILVKYSINTPVAIASSVVVLSLIQSLSVPFAKEYNGSVFKTKI